MPLIPQALVEEELLGTLVRDERPTKLELLESVVESRKPAVNPRLHVQDVRVLAVGEHKQKCPPLPLLASGPNVGELP